MKDPHCGGYLGTCVVARKLPKKIEKQIDKAGLPRAGTVPFIPQLDGNKKSREIIRKATVTHGPKQGKKGYVDTKGRIWIKDRAHAGDPEHWDVQEDGGKSYLRVDPQGNLLP
jgi:hypothetical protein